MQKNKMPKQFTLSSNNLTYQDIKTLLEQPKVVVEMPSHTPNVTSQTANEMLTKNALGIGEPILEEIIRLMLVFKAKSLLSNSNISTELVTRLVDLHNKNILPVVYHSNNLITDHTPLAHLSLPLIAKGEVWNGGMKFKSKTVLDIMGVEPLPLSTKEAEALLTGAEFKTAIGAYSIVFANRLLTLKQLLFQEETSPALNQTMSEITQVFFTEINHNNATINHQELNAALHQLTNVARAIAENKSSIKEFTETTPNHKNAVSNCLAELYNTENLLAIDFINNKIINSASVIQTQAEYQKKAETVEMFYKKVQIAVKLLRKYS